MTGRRNLGMLAKEFEAIVVSWGGTSRYLRPVPGDLAYLRHQSKHDVVGKVRLTFRVAVDARHLCGWWDSAGLGPQRLLAVRQHSPHTIDALIALEIVPRHLWEWTNRARETLEARNRPRPRIRILPRPFRPIHQRDSRRIDGHRPKSSIQRVSQVHDHDRRWRGFR
jgi:hypothetical protein